MREIKKIILHCSDTTGGDAATIRAQHMAPPPEGRGFSDIAYHYIIDNGQNRHGMPDGIIEVGRLEMVEGAHCLNHNYDSIGVCFVGVTVFSQAQMDAGRKLVNSLLQKYGLTKDDVFGHCEMDTGKAQGKTCPNFDMNNFRSTLQGEKQ